MSEWAFNVQWNQSAIVLRHTLVDLASRLAFTQSYLFDPVFISPDLGSLKERREHVGCEELTMVLQVSQNIPHRMRKNMLMINYVSDSRKERVH